MEHSRLLKFLVTPRTIPKMAEPPPFKVQIDYKDPDNVEAEVPVAQQLREVGPNESDVTTSDGQYTLEPVITVTKKESTFTKGDLKLQKVTVTEDISISETQNGEKTTSRHRYQGTIHKDGHTFTRSISSEKHTSSREAKTHDEKKSRIPMLKFRQAAETVKKEKKTQKNDQTEKHPRRSSIPRLKKETKITAKPEEAAPEDEFDKIYGEIVDDKQEDIDDKLLETKIEDPDKLESKFEEIIHAYEDENDVQHVEVTKVQLREKQSKIPALRRRKADSGSANLTAIVDNIRLKNAVRKSQEFSNEEVTEGFTRITTRRIYSERSREVTSVEKIEPRERRDTQRPDEGQTITHTIVKTENNGIPNEGNSRHLRKTKLDALRAKYTADDITTTVNAKMERQNEDNATEHNQSNNNISETKYIGVKNPIELDKKEENIAIPATNTELAETNSVKAPIHIQRKITQHITTNNGTKREYSNSSTIEVVNKEGTKNLLTACTESTSDHGTHTITQSTSPEDITTISNIENNILHINEITRTTNNSAKTGTTFNKPVVTVQSSGGKEINDLNISSIESNTEDKNKNLSVKQVTITKQISSKLNIPENTAETTTIQYTDTTIEDSATRYAGNQAIKTEQVIKESIKIGIPSFTKITETSCEESVHCAENEKSLTWKPKKSIEKSVVTEFADTVQKKPQIENIEYTNDPIKTNSAMQGEPISSKEEIIEKIQEKNSKESKLIDNNETGDIVDKEYTNNNSGTLDKDELDVMILRGNVSRLINRLSFREATPTSQTSKKKKEPDDTEHVERVRRIDKMISNFGKLNLNNTTNNLERKEYLTVNKQEIQNVQSVEDEKDILKQDENKNIENLSIQKGSVSRIVSNIGSNSNTTVNTTERVTEYIVNKKLNITESTNNITDTKTAPISAEIKDISISNLTTEDSINTEYTSGPKLLKKESSNALEGNKDTELTGTINKHEIDNYMDDTKEKIHINIEEKKANYTIGHVEGLVERVTVKESVISRDTKAEPKEADTIIVKELPKRKTVLSKVAIFENLETKEPYPRGKVTRSDIKISKLVTKDISEKPRIVDEVLKKDVTNRVEVDDVDTTKLETKRVNEIWRTSFNKVNTVQNISVVRDVKEINLKTYNSVNEISFSNNDMAEIEANANENNNQSSLITTTLTNKTTKTGSEESIRPNIYFIPNDNKNENALTPNENEVHITYQVTTKGNADDIRPNIYFIPNEDKLENVITASDNDVNKAVLTEITISTDQYSITNTNNDNVISEVKTIPDSTYIENKDQSTVTTVITNVTTNTLTTDGQNTVNDTNLKENTTNDIKYKVQNPGDCNSGAIELKDMENFKAIYERVRAKCAKYERNVSTISQQLSRSESKEYSSYRTIDDGPKSADFNIDFGVKKITEDEFRRKDLRQSKSVVEADLGDAVKGAVSRLVGRLKSVEFERSVDVKVEKINIKERPPRSSVLEKIALFEGKLTASKMEASIESRIKVTKKTAPQGFTEEQYLEKISELSSVRSRFQKTEEIPNLVLNNGVEMPVIALGTALLDSRLLPHIIGAAIDLGYRAFDCAYIYGNEKEVGSAIRAKIEDGTVRREDLFIISKLWSTFHRPDLVEVACKSSLEAMGLTYFDLYMIHNPMSFKEGGAPIPKIATVLQYSQHDYLDAWFGMEDLVAKGLARSIGVSNFNSVQLQRVLDKGRVIPVVNQVECHPYLSQERLHNFCFERNVSISCYGVLGSKGTPAELKNSLPAAIDDPLVLVMASGLNVTAAQLLIRYQLQQGHSVVVKSSSATHLWDNLQALTFSLTEAQIQALQALNRNKRTFAFIGMGDTHKNYPFLAAF